MAVNPFQSSCEATGLRNSISAKPRASDLIVSILLRGNGVAQLRYLDAWRRRDWLFQSSCEATGLRNSAIAVGLRLCR